MAQPGRRAVRWISTAGAGEAGDAGEVSAEIEAWLARRSAPADWDGVLGALRDGLLRLSLDPRVARDPGIAAILADLGARAEDPDVLDALLGTALDALADRVSALAGDAPAPEGARAPAADAASPPRPARMIFRL